MKKFKNMNLADQLMAIFLTKVQEYSLKLQYLSNCDKLIRILEFIFDRSSRAHLELFTGYDLDILIDKFPDVDVESQTFLTNTILLPFCRRNAAISLKEAALYSNQKFTRRLVKVGGIVLLIKLLFKCSELEAIEYMKSSAEKLNGHGKTTRTSV